ncbi:MAG: phycobiliprotein lyase [Prochlorotrichaceae cyanobacterium]
MDAMEFFRRSEGHWRSQRTTHHLPFRRAESGDSVIRVRCLSPQDDRVIETCGIHSIDPALSVGGAAVLWQGSMEWDREEENHEGEAVFAIVPDEGNPRAGRLLRDRGYAETAPVIGRYYLDAEDALVMTTDYETMSSEERFWFPHPNLRLRTSTVKLFGGLNKATFCAETRVLERNEESPTIAEWDQVSLYSSLGW